MNILYISSHEEWGRAFNGKALHQRLLQEGYQSTMAVLQPQVFDEGVVRIGRKSARIFNRGLTVLENILSLQSVLPVLGMELYRSPAFQQADIVHFQIFHSESFISLLSLAKLCQRKKVVFTIHDMWPLTGHCINPFGCERWMSGCGHCPDLASPLPMRRDNTHWMWTKKQEVFSKLDISLVAGSQWLLERIQKSPILQQKPVYHIPFGVDPRIFRPRDRQSTRKKLGLPQNAFVIAFRSTIGSYDLKGTRYLIDSLMQLDLGQAIFLLSFDRLGSAADLRSRYQILELGWVKTPQEMAEALSAADLFAAPSLADTFGLMAVESLACGTPVVTFEGTAIPEVIQAPQGGLAVPARNTQSLAEAIQRLYQDPASRCRLREYGLDLVQKEYTFDRYYERHLDLYQRLLDQHSAA